MEDEVLAPSSPAGHAAAIVPDDTNPLENATRAIYVGSEGDLTLVTVNGEEVTFVGAAASLIIPIRAHSVKETGTTAGNLVALW